MNHRKQIPIPTGWAVDKDGKVSIKQNYFPILFATYRILIAHQSTMMVGNYYPWEEERRHVSSEPHHCSLQCINHTPLAGYKGYGLATMVDVLCGVMSGGPYGERIRKWTGDPSEADLVWTWAQLFIP